MSKKILFSLIFIISFSCIWAVWEGNGGIGSPADFPSEGLFVRSDMFPKHTLLEITNLEKSIKARAVVIGPSGIPGLLVSLSPELGEKLRVSKGKVIRIRVITPNPVNEDGDDGKSSSAASPESQDLDTNPALFVASHSDLPNANLKKEETKPVSENREGDIILYDEVESPAYKPDTSEKIEETPDITIILPAEPTLEKPAEEEDVSNADTIASPVIEEPVEIISEPAVKEMEEIAAVPEEVEPIAETYMEPAKENPPITVESINEPKTKKEAPPAPVSEVSEPQEPEQNKEEIKDVEVVDPVTEPVYAAPADEKKAEIIASAGPKNEPLSDKPITDIEEKKEEPHVPFEEPSAPLEEIPVENIPSEEDETENLYDETDSEIYGVASEDKIEDGSIADLNTPEPVSSKLEKGKTYVQIVIYNDKYKRDETVKKYEKNYPIVVEESFVKNNTRYTIFVGPLKPQETGAVLERFKQLGFKDAFLKKGK